MFLNLNYFFVTNEFSRKIRLCFFDHIVNSSAFQIAGTLLVVISLLFVLYALAVYHWRRRAIVRRIVTKVTNDIVLSLLLCQNTKITMMHLKKFVIAYEKK